MDSGTLENTWSTARNNRGGLWNVSRFPEKRAHTHGVAFGFLAGWTVRGKKHGTSLGYLTSMDKCCPNESGFV
jgi:hypothetical protein